MGGSHPCPSLTKVKILGNTNTRHSFKSRVFIYEILERITFVALKSTRKIRNGEAELQLESKCTPASSLIYILVY